MARIHVGSATYIKLVGFNIHLLLYVKQGGEIPNIYIYIGLSLFLFFSKIYNNPVICL